MPIVELARELVMGAEIGSKTYSVPYRARHTNRRNVESELGLEAKQQQAGHGTPDNRVDRLRG